MLDGIHALARLDDALHGFEYTSVQVPVSDGMISHRDASNAGPSWTMSVGSLQGGLLWVKSKDERTLPPYTATGLGPE
eukprot:12803845-Prorocentrum_lima.AAC.1